MNRQIKRKKGKFSYLFGISSDTSLGLGLITVVEVSGVAGAALRAREAIRVAKGVWGNMQKGPTNIDFFFRCVILFDPVGREASTGRGGEVFTSDRV